MAGVVYSLVDFVTGRPIVDALPVMEGAEWSAQLGRADSVSCSIDLRDPDNLALDLRASSEPNKTILLARTEADVVLAWGMIGDDGREWDEDEQVVTLTAAGIRSTWLGQNPITPLAALDPIAELLIEDAEGYDVVNPAFDTTVSGVSHGTIGKRLIEQLLTLPGAPQTFDLPADELGTRTQTYSFAALKKIGAALDDLTAQEGGPDFAFDAYRDPDGLRFRWALRHGSEAKPRLGGDVGSWSLGPGSPISGLKISDAVAGGASVGWMTAGRGAGSVLISRKLNSGPTIAGYPPLAVIDTSHSDVSVQATLDSYNAANLADAQTTTRDLSFVVRGDASPSLGQYRPGDTITISVGDGHPWHVADIPIRLTSIKGDETGDDVTIGCVILNG